MNQERFSRRQVFEVTPEIIEQATARNSGHCVVADAIKLAIPTASKVSVDLQTIRFSVPETGKRYIYLTPQPVQNILLDFDQGEVPTAQSIRLGRPVQITSINRQRKPSGGGTVISVRPSDSAVTKEGGQVPRRGALAHPPSRKVENRRYAGQRRIFGLKILRP